MTDKEAIKWLNKNRPCISMTCNKENADNINIATDMAIEALEERLQGNTYTFEQVKELIKLNQQFAQEIEKLKKPHGEWVYGEDECGQDGWFCSECGFFVPWYYKYYENDIDFIREYKACPHCIAEMITYTGKEEAEND